MTRDDFVGALKDLGLPVAHIKFKSPQNLPYIAYGFNDRDFYADDSHFFKTKAGWLELYTEDANHEIDINIREIFERGKIPYEFLGESYLDDQQMCLYLWNFQLY